MKTKDKTYSVYRHTAPDGKVYIGISSMELKKRWDSGRGYKNNSYFTRSIEKYGWANFKHEVIYTDLSEDVAKEKEIELIAKHKSNERKYGFNISSGGESHAGIKISEWHKQQISKASKGRIVSVETRSKLSVASRRVWNNKEHVDRMRELNLGANNHQYGVKRTDEEKLQRGAKPVIQKDMNGNLVNMFISIHQAGDITHIARDSIKKACNGIFKQAGGYLWEYKR